MKDSILCAIDFSESSAHALQWAYKVALGANAPLSVLFSYRLIQTGRVNDILLFKRKTEDEAQKRFLELRKDLMNGRQIPINFIIEIGFLSDNIENYIRKHPNTMVVVGDSLADTMYEHKNLSLLHFMKNLNAPLLVVPQPVHENGSPVKQLDPVKL